MVWMLLMLGCGESGPPSSASVSASAQGLPAWAGDKTTLWATKDLRTEDLVVGKGPTATGGDKVTVHYTGWLVSGQQFDSSYTRGKPFSAILGRNQVIQGWDVGVRGMAVGGKRGMVLPPHLAYGDRGAPPAIPPNSVLVFEIELIGLDPDQP